MAAVPPIVAVDVSVNPVPVTVMTVPVEPLVGAMLVITGATPNVAGLLVPFAVVTVTEEVPVTVDGTVAVRDVAEL